jgi:hypothetical protein
VIAISPDHIVALGSFPPAPLNGNNFTVTAPASSLKASGLTCPQGTIIHNGTVAVTIINGLFRVTESSATALPSPSQEFLG